MIEPATCRSMSTLKPWNIVFIISIICGLSMLGPPAGVGGLAALGLSLKVTVRFDTPPVRVIAKVTGLSSFGAVATPPVRRP